MTQPVGIAEVGPKRTTSVCLWLGIMAVGLVTAGAFGAGQGLWSFGPGLLMVAIGFLLAVVALFCGLFAAWRNPSGSGLGRRIVIGLLATVAVLIAVGPWIYRGFAYPPIHDVSTDLANPPTFSTLPLRKDILAGVADAATWRSIHAKAYGDIRPVTVNVSPDVAIARARAFATAQGWTIAPTPKDRLEATETVSPFRFGDDVVVIATPTADGQASLVNIRSVSRVGIGDFGINAKRVRALLRAIESGKGG